MGVKIKILVLLAAFASGWMANGWRLGEDIAQNERDLAQAAELQAAAVISFERLGSAKSNAIAAKTAAESNAANAKGRVVIKKVIEYVQSPDSGKCDLSGEWVRIHDQATSILPAAASTASASNDPASGVTTDRDALIAVTSNYEACQANMIKLRGLQEWAGSLGQ